MKTLSLEKVFLLPLQLLTGKTMSESQNTNRAAIHARIIEVAAQQFREKGIKAVRMDDLADVMCISKRTIYEEFEDKKALLRATLVHFKEKMTQMQAQYMSEAENVLEGMLNISRYSLDLYASVNPVYFQDLERYPEIMEAFHEGRTEHAAQVKAFMQKGVEQGIFLPEVNYDIYLRSHELMSDKAMKTLRDEFGGLPVFRVLFLYSMRGICTQKGIDMIDAFIKESKN